MREKLVISVAIALLYIPIGMFSQAWAGPPFVTDDPEPVEYKHWELYIASQFANDKNNASGTVVSGTAPHLEVNYGVIPDTQLHLIVPFAYNHSQGGTTQYGLGDVELGVKYRFLHEKDLTPQAALFPLIELPTGDEDKGLGEGHVKVLIPLWLQKSWGPWTTYGGGGYWLNRIHAKPGDRNFWQLGWLVQREINKTVSMGAEVFHFTRTNDEEEHNRTGFNVGSFINLSEDHHILLSAGRDFRGDNRFSAYVAYQWTFGPHEDDKKVADAQQSRASFMSIQHRCYGSSPKTVNRSCVPTYTFPLATVGTENLTANPGSSRDTFWSLL